MLFVGFGYVITALVIGVVVGYILAIPPGPISMASIRTAVRDNLTAALKLIAGAGLFDVVYCALAMMATSAVVKALVALENTSPLAPLAIQLSIVVLMIVFGIFQMREKPVQKIDEDSKPRASGFVEWVKGHGPFFVGVGFALANLANPTFVPALAGMTTFIQKLEWFELTLLNSLAFSLGFGVGNVLWLTTLVRLVVAFRHRMTPTFILRIQQVSGVTLIGFGTFYGLRIILLTKWHELLRLIFAA
ncbi:MAG: LysE family transporter [Bradyrhizobiaceae bacterium]|nr:LysE family transporter [Bradyrhizobiaceae bacterium]